MAAHFMEEISTETEEELQEAFEQAAQYLKNIIGELETEQLLYFYARFKQAKEGKCTVQRPGFFDFQGKQKWDAWNKLHNMPASTAMEQYVQAMNDIDPEWQLKADEPEHQKKKKEGWVCTSTMASPDEDIDDGDKTVFDWCKEGDVKRVACLLDKNNVDAADEEGMTLLHWACDRGLEDMVQVLIDHKADVNSRDADQQTPLHYAAACEHVAVARTLLAAGANVTLQDSDGLTPIDAADSQIMSNLLAQSS